MNLSKHWPIFFMLINWVYAQAETSEALNDANEIVARANLAAYYAGTDGRSEARMTIHDAQGRKQRRQFTILRHNIAAGGDQDFLVVFSQPSDVRGTVYLVNKHVDRDDDRWLYLPGLDLIKRVVAGDNRTSFVGAHYYYEDVSGRSPNDDQHTLIATDEEYYRLEHAPKDPSMVEFDRYRSWIDRKNFLPMKIEYLDTQGKVFRRVEVIEVETIQEYPTVTKSRVSDLSSGAYTDLQFRYIAYDLNIPADVFTERSMRSPPRQWLRRPQG